MPLGLSETNTFKVVTVSKAPDHATIMLKRVAERFQGRLIVIHAANCERVEEVDFRVRDLQPDIVAWTTSWSAADINTIKSIARRYSSAIDLCALPEEWPDTASAEIIFKRLEMYRPLRTLS